MTAFLVPGPPVAQPRPRVGIDRRTGRPRTYREEAHPVHAYRAEVALRARQTFPRPLAGPLRVAMLFAFAPANAAERALTDWAWKPAAPDCDNLAKAAADALKGVAWGDDAQVVVWELWKAVAPAGMKPFTRIGVGPAPPPAEALAALLGGAA
jgi:Holliday junction resolvase RusA-like endonuclease